VVVGVVGLSGCRDQDAEAFARASMAHQTLLQASARPDDPRFVAVVADLRSVTATSKHHAQAQSLLKSVLAARSAVRTPLALGANEHRPPPLQAQLSACARLAERAGADGGVDRRALEALEDCRMKAEKLELTISHGDDLADAGP
jgi:hypothetical protein